MSEKTRGLTPSDLVGGIFAGLRAPIPANRATRHTCPVQQPVRSRKCAEQSQVRQTVMMLFTQWLRRSMVFMIGIFLLSVPQLSGQTVSPTGGTVPAANQADVFSIDGIMAAIYDVVSGPAGEERDWNRFRSLFDTDARLIPTSPRQDGNEFSAQMWGVNDYIEINGPSLSESGFFEVESNRVTETFENITQVFSTYESRRTPDGPVFMRGINSIQLMFDGQRWWVMNIMWRSVGADFEFAERYLQPFPPR